MKQRNARSVARLTVKEGKIPLAILKQDRFPKLKESPPDALGKTFVLRAESGKNLTLKIQLHEGGPSKVKAETVQKERQLREKVTTTKKVPSKQKVQSKERKK